MARKRIAKVVRAVTNRLWQRDRLQMRAADAVFAALERNLPRPRAAAKARPRKRRAR